MIRAGMRPQEYADALRDERFRRGAEANPAASDDGAPDAVDPGDQTISAVDIAPRPPSD